MKSMRRAGIATAAALAAAAAIAGDAPRRNWFNDPFFQVRADVPSCPVPLGPLLTEAEMKSESHSRVERGTSCWMAGQCEQPNAYLYDAKIAQAVRERLEGSPVLRGASLWIMVKRRFVWAQGCVADSRQATDIETLLKSVPDVERVLVDVMPGARGRPPYPVLPEK